MMANNVQEMQVSSLPLPPTQYINLYTDENIRRNRAPRPPPPIHDVYTIFGEPYNNDEMIRTMESQNIKRLIPLHYDRRKELKKLNHSLFASFLDLIDILILNPDSPRRTEKIDDLNILFLHMHHLLNEFRPHQARETLRVMMEMQKRQRCETIIRLKKHLDRVRQLVNTAFTQLPEIKEEDEKYADQLKAELDSQAAAAAASHRTDEKYVKDSRMCKLLDEME